MVEINAKTISTILWYGGIKQIKNILLIVQGLESTTKHDNYMKRILFIALVLITSCASNEEKIAELKEKVVLVETKLDIQRIENENLKTHRTKLLNRMDSVSKTVDEHYLPKEYLSLVTKRAFHYIFDKKKVIKMFFDDFNLKEYDVERGIANSYYLSPYAGDYEKVDSEYDLFHSIFASVDRSPEALQRLFTEEVKQIIYALFESNDLYEDTGAEAMVEALLLAYEELADDYETLPQIYDLAAKDYLSGYDEINEIIAYTATDEVREILSDENYTNYDNDVWSEIDSRLFLVYTFWARRYHEENQAVVYSLLKEFHRNVTKKKASRRGS